MVDGCMLFNSKEINQTNNGTPLHKKSHIVQYTINNKSA